VNCIRCKEEFGGREHCRNCGVHKDRVVRYIRRRKIGGKRGRNSGTTNKSKEKKN
jgi:hypothetical protein